MLGIYWYEHVTTYPEAIAFSSACLSITVILVYAIKLLGQWTS